jgi:hypothetical protein
MLCFAVLDFKGKTGNGDFTDVLAQTDAYEGWMLDSSECHL